jgi:endonuclease/exonuclease/phosphatase family metal-dependent hydrolase
MKKTTLFVAVACCFFACKKEQSAHKPEPAKTASAHTETLTAAAPNLNPFKVMSFNVRNPNADDPFSADERKSYILKVILDSDADIVGLQEIADNNIEAWFNTQMANAGYGIYKGGFDFYSPKTIWYKNARFTRTNAGSFTMTTPDTRSGKWVVLQDKLAPANSYFVVNSHWTTVSSAQRSMGADTILNAIKTNNTQNLPVICFGDFNGEPGSPEINKIKDGSGLNMVDALFEHQGEPTYHRWEPTGVKKIDYIMSTRNLAFTGSDVITTSFTVNGQTLWPSDHFPIVATYTQAIFGGTHVDANGKSASSITRFYFADINGDGKKDKIYWNRTYDGGKPQVYLSNGNGTFAATAVVHTAGASTLSSTRYHYADVNGDGKEDEILWDPTLNAGHTRVYLATTNGSFSSTVVDNPEGTSQGSTTVFNFADVNGDGKADKIYWNATFDNGRTRVYLATSGGNFSGSVVAGAEGASTTGGTSFYYVDVNGDNKTDKILWHPTLNSGKPSVYLSDGDGTFTASSTFTNSGASSASDATLFSFADINGDGWADKIYWNPTIYLGEPKVYFADASNTFKGPVYSLRGTSQSANTIFYYSDINGDGKADQIRWNYGENNGELRNYFAN